jgi:hypothetical protein
MAKRGRPRKTPEPISEEQEVEVMEVEDANVVEETTDNEPFEAEVQEQVQTESQDPLEGTFGNYNPLADNVIEREYATPKTAEGLTDDIPEPSFEQDLSFDDLMNTPSAEEEEEGNPFDNPNPSLNDLPPQEKQIACESMVDTVLDTYAGLHKVASNFAKFPEEKLNQSILNDEIDGTMRMPLESGGDVSLQEFVQSYNEQAEEVLSYDREFGMKVRPAMIRVFMKKGWGMTDEQYLIFMFGKDILAKTTQFIGLKKSINSTMNLLKEIHEESKGGIPTDKAERVEQEDVYEEEIPVQTQRRQEPQVQEMILDDETEIGQGLDNSEYEVQTQKMNIHEFKRPQETNHPDLVQKEMDKANAEANAKEGKK